MSKNYRGGYKLIDLQKNDFLSLEVGVVIKGIYKVIEASYNKPLLLTGIVIDGVEKNDVLINELKVVDGNYVLKAYGYEITINDEDEVEAIEIYVPVVKSVTTSAERKTIDIKDGDEYLLLSTVDSTVFELPDECYLVGEVTSLLTGNFISGFTSHADATNIVTIKNKEVYIKRIGNMILVSAPYEI